MLRQSYFVQRADARFTLDCKTIPSEHFCRLIISPIKLEDSHCQEQAAPLAVICFLPQLRQVLNEPSEVTYSEYVAKGGWLKILKEEE